MNRFLLFFSLSLLLKSLIACKSETHQVAKNSSFDSVLYTIKNSKTMFSIDSILNKKTVRYCDFRFSKFYDTLVITFNLADTLTMEENTTLRTSRFLIIKDKRIKLMSNEDFILTTEVINRNVHYDPYYISVELTIPDYSIIGMGSFPPT